MSDVTAAPPEEPEDEFDAIVEAPFDAALSERYLIYAMSTITARSLPDLRDGLKPVHRRLLWAMRLLKLDPSQGYKKCARVVGDVIGKYHPHGDQSVYDAMVRLAQTFSLRYPLVDGQGNFGNIDGDNAAAYRYTEARLTRTAIELMSGLDENAADLKPTYNGEDEEPEVMPGLFPIWSLISLNRRSACSTPRSIARCPNAIWSMRSRRSPRGRCPMCATG